jgi:hypothetical protein
MATLSCITCHTVRATGTPTHIDTGKAFQGGFAVTVSGTQVESSNLTPDSTGIMGWTTDQLANAVLNATDDRVTPAKALCGMRGVAMSQSDADDVATYLLGLTPVVHATSSTCP